MDEGNGISRLTRDRKKWDAESPDFSATPASPVFTAAAKAVSKVNMVTP